MSNHPLLKTVCSNADKLCLKIWPISACASVIGIVYKNSVDSEHFSWVLVLTSLLLLNTVLFCVDWYVKLGLIKDLSKILLEIESRNHKDIEFLKKILTNMIYFWISIFVVIFIFLHSNSPTLNGWVTKPGGFQIFLVDVPFQIVFFIKFKKFKTLYGL